MTGEVTLRGLVLPVGGIKRIVMPARNEKDLQDIPKNVRDEMEFKFAKKVDEVLDWALEGGFPALSGATQAAAQA